VAIDEGLIDWVREALEPVGAVTMRRMMGGATLYCDGTVFAIEHGGEIWFKADAESDAEWDAAACPRFTYEMGEGRTGSFNYRRGPADIYDDPEAMRVWAALGIAAGQRGAAKKKPRRKKG